MDKFNQEFNQNGGGTEKTVTWKTLGWILCLSPALVASDTAIHGLAIGIYAFLIIALSDGAWELKPAAFSDKIKTPFCLICALYWRRCSAGFICRYYITASGNICPFWRYTAYFS